MDLSSYTVWTIVPPWFGLPWTFFLWMFFPSGPFFRGPSFLNPNVCMVWHHFTSPGSAHRSAITGRTHVRCSADQHKLFVPRTSTSMFGPRAFCSSGPLSWNALPSQRPSHLHQHLRTILENLSFQQLFWLCFILHLHVLGFLRFSQRTRFRDSFCLASVF